MSKSILCGLLGISRQAHHQQEIRSFKEEMEEELILQYVIEKRRRQPQIGCRKLHMHMQEELFVRSEIRIGRDCLIDLLRRENLLVKRRKKRPVTTNSNHAFRRYPNLIRNKITTAINEVWVSDITYIDTEEGYLYLFLITDVYSRKIIGYHVGITMEAIGAIKALEKALKELPLESQTIHHSDRGLQYACTDYTKILHNKRIQISMTENGDPLENCIAERVNGLIKSLIQGTYTSKVEALISIPEIITIYNKEVKHGSIGMLTPQQAYESNTPFINRWKGKPSVASI